MLDLSLHILDIAENSIRAGAKTVYINVMENTQADRLTLEILDDGSGMNEEILKRVADPFFTTKTVRKIGLGLPMLAQAAEISGGNLTVASKEGEGTKVRADFILSHIDRQPLGDLTGAICALIAGNADTAFVYRHTHNRRVYLLDTREVKKEIEDIPINHFRVLDFIRNHITEGLREIGAGS